MSKGTGDARSLSYHTSDFSAPVIPPLRPAEDIIADVRGLAAPVGISVVRRANLIRAGGGVSRITRQRLLEADAILRVLAADSMPRMEGDRVPREALELLDVFAQAGDLVLEVSACRLLSSEKHDERAVLVHGDGAEVLG